MQKNDEMYRFIDVRGNGVMDSTLACCTGSPGLIPAFGKSNEHYSDVILPLGIRWQVKKGSPGYENNKRLIKTSNKKW